MATDAQLLEARKRGKKYSEIADFFGLSVDSVRSRVYRAQRATIIPFEDVGGGLFSIIRARQLDVPPIRLMPMVDADEIIVSGDWHVPTTDWRYLEVMCRFAEKHMRRGHRKLALVGDLFNFDGISKYEHVTPPYSLEHELSAAETTIDYVMRTFDTVYLAMGNHDERFTRLLSGALGVERLVKLFSRHMERGRLVATDLRQMETTSGGVHWRLTHQRNYSKNKGIVAARLCLKHQTNIITHHEHHVGVGRDDFNRYTWVNNGMMADAEKMRYVMHSDSTSNVMCKGFTFLRNGTAHLLTPYATITDWDMWKMGNLIQYQEMAA